MSAKKAGQDGGADGSETPATTAPSSLKPKRQSRSGDLGRALRTVYDDTLRESVPDDFMDLLGKLS
ncbi:MAG: NepR family anti-sigma factor [Sphingomicrobium sp.]